MSDYEPTDDQYLISGLSVAIFEPLAPTLVLTALECTSSGREFDEAIDAAVAAKDWLAKIAPATRHRRYG